MIEIAMEQDFNNRTIALECSGHAGFDDGQGLDLVCSAVSALTGALGLGLAEKSQPPLRVSVDDGHFAVDLRGQAASSEAHFLLDTIASSLLLLAQNYPGFCSIRRMQQVADRSERRNPP